MYICCLIRRPGPIRTIRVHILSPLRVRSRRSRPPLSSARAALNTLGVNHPAQDRTLRPTLEQISVGHNTLHSRISLLTTLSTSRPAAASFLVPASPILGLCDGGSNTRESTRRTRYVALLPCRGLSAPSVWTKHGFEHEPGFGSGFGFGFGFEYEFHYVVLSLFVCLSCLCE